MPKLYSELDMNNLALKNPKCYSFEEINSLFSDVSETTLEKYQGLIVDSIVSSYFVYSSYKTKEEIDKALSEANTFATELFSKVSTMSTTYCTSLPTEGNSSTIYVLEKTLDDGSVVHLINLWNSETSSYVETGSLESALNNVVTNEDLSNTLNDYALKTEVIKTDDLTTEITETSTNGEVPTALAVKNAIDNASVKISAEANNQIVEKTDGIYVAPEEEEISWADYQALSEEEKKAKTYFIPDMPVNSSGTVIGDVEYCNARLSSVQYPTSGTLFSANTLVLFESLDTDTIKVTNGLVTLKKGKVYNIICDIRGDFSGSGHVMFCLKDTNGNTYGKDGLNMPSVTSGNEGSHCIYSYTLNPSEDVTVGMYITSASNLRALATDLNKLIITEIPSYQGLINVSDEHIKEVVSNNITDIPTTTITSFASSTITGNLYYRVANGICYVSVCPLQNTAIATDIDVCQLPKPIFPLNSNLASNTNGNNIGIVWMNPDTTLKARFFVANTVGYTTFSYPVLSN